MMDFNNGRNVTFQLKSEMLFELRTKGSACIRVHCGQFSSKKQTIDRAVAAGFLIIINLELRNHNTFYYDLAPTEEGLAYLEYHLL